MLKGMGKEKVQEFYEKGKQKVQETLNDKATSDEPPSEKGEKQKKKKMSFEEKKA